MDGFEEEQETLCAGDRVQGGPKELRGDSESQLVLTSLRKLWNSLCSVSAPWPWEHHLAGLGFLFFICEMWLWDPHGGYYIKALHGAGTSQPLCKDFPLSLLSLKCQAEVFELDVSLEVLGTFGRIWPAEDRGRRVFREGRSLAGMWPTKKGQTVTLRRSLLLEPRAEKLH